MQRQGRRAAALVASLLAILIISSLGVSVLSLMNYSIRRGERDALRARAIALHATALVILLATIAPFVWLVITSISETAELVDYPIHWIPARPTINRYQALLFPGSAPLISALGQDIILSVEAFRRSLLNSFLVAAGTTVLCLTLGCLAAYAFSRLRFRFRGSLFYLAVILHMVPSAAIMVPLYIIMRSMRLMDTHLVLILLYSTFSLTYVIWIMNGYFATLPRELEDAARIDGCTRVGTLWRIILPMASPGLVATGALTFLGAWNEFTFALIFTNTAAARTVPVTVTQFSSAYYQDFGLMSAGGVLASIPPVVLALIFQRYILQGLTAGAVKG